MSGRRKNRVSPTTGLTEGFHQSGVAEARWAVEKDEAAANAFKLNYPDSIVLTDDCNLILRYVMDVRLLTSSSLLSSLSLYLAPNVHLFPLSC